MHNQDTPTDRLITELESVARSLMIQKISKLWIVTAFVTKDHTGDHVQGYRENVFIEGTGNDLASAVDDVLGKIAQAAPMAATA